MSYTETAAKYIGRQVERVVEGQVTSLTIQALSDSEKGKLANGKEVPALVLADATATETVLSPKDANRLFRTGASLAYKIVGDLIPSKAETERAEKAAAPVVETKKEKAIVIMKAGEAASKARKEVIADLVTEVGMSQSCASTYFQNYKSKAKGWE